MAGDLARRRQGEASAPFYRGAPGSAAFHVRLHFSVPAGENVVRTDRVFGIPPETAFLDWVG
jgi:hypothetical protein